MMILRSGGKVKIKPVVTNIIKTRHTSFEVELQLENNITFIIGESGTGKTALYIMVP